MKGIKILSKREINKVYGRLNEVDYGELLGYLTAAIYTAKYHIFPLAEGFASSAKAFGNISCDKVFSVAAVGFFTMQMFSTVGRCLGFLYAKSQEWRNDV